MTWHLGPMVGFDLETTGPDPESARIVTATIVHVGEGVLGAERTVQPHEWLINPGMEIPAEATAVHGITTDRAITEGVDPFPAVVEIARELDDAWSSNTPVVIYNASYDLTLLDRELRRHYSQSLSSYGPVIDPFVIDKHLDRYRKGKRTLTATCEHYNVRLDGAHDATADALAAVRLAWRLAQFYPAQLGDLSKVNELQAAWREAWAVNFEDYLRQQGKVEHVDRSWPIRPKAVA